ncbi:hypothetical protein Back11_36490 [Paenibacillus baekrokdamisoli]|uniref:Uncharacterized protein n=1 Tax=Paenibacillus baekrokdamisoli TaxID=1712516 RepID=A0A3G9JGS4_9BACL|nr:saccharopine dehydrogenase NADP-binding domain-containing protein [Paenibacillus baekrokdamisoli]MBB3073348.1 saccharopine dehydrogenase-like NADP-dependent oxidoreductase [Paenibacillus baekrokdamisoli]BBH22304.1 hypothetical protein Back11_36490 [Paenibacillus baekrokdamisoli]
MKENIVVVGGYGHVGQTICRELGELYPGKVFAAGRSLERAEQFTRTSGGKIKPLQLNINETVDPDFLSSVKLVIMCLDQKNTTFVKACFAKGIHYVDISANHSFLSQVEELHSEAAANRATSVLSVGLAPGLTNLMASHASRLMDKTEIIDISIMLGLGEQHGDASIKWTVDNLSKNFAAIQNNESRVVSSFTDGKKTDFGAGLGKRAAYRFDFSDQHVLPRTLGVPTVSTRLCFDSAAMTRLLAWMRASGLFRIVKLKPIRSAVIGLFSKMRYGKELFAVKIDAKGKKNQEDMLIECFLTGENEADITARVAAAVADHVYRTVLPHGVFHVEQLLALDKLLPYIEQRVSFQTLMNGKRF